MNQIIYQYIEKTKPVNLPFENRKFQFKNVFLFYSILNKQTKKQTFLNSISNENYPVSALIRNFLF